MKNIILIGMPGCGKTTIGKKLAKKLNREFIDSDQVFVDKIGTNISDFFVAHSETEFRSEETAILRQLTQKSGCIIATGGGIVERAENKDILKSGGIVVFINRSPEDIIECINVSTRPLLADDKNRIFELYKRRLSKYKDFCHIEVKNSGPFRLLTDKIINEVNSYNG